MKLITYLENGKEKVGALTADEKAVRPLPFADMLAAVEAGLEAVKAAPQGPAAPLEGVKLLAPIPRPRQDVICLGVNYASHAKEAKWFSSDHSEKPVPIYFSKRVNEAVAPGGTIPRHGDVTKELDYEAELALIIGRTAKNVPLERAAEHIFGYTVLNDVSARDVQHAHQQWYFGKSLDGFTPMGPCIVTADEIPFPPALDITSFVNGERRQSSNTQLLITGLGDIIAELSSGMTLLPGTIITTGTPSGVGLGFDPPRYLKSGDKVECAIEGIGVLCNTVE